MPCGTFCELSTTEKKGGYYNGQGLLMFYVFHNPLTP